MRTVKIWLAEGDYFLAIITLDFNRGLVDDELSCVKAGEFCFENIETLLHNFGDDLVHFTDCNRNFGDITEIILNFYSLSNF